jgi:hypothetical protein
MIYPNHINRSSILEHGSTIEVLRVTVNMLISRSIDKGQYHCCLKREDTGELPPGKYIPKNGYIGTFQVGELNDIKDDTIKNLRECSESAEEPEHFDMLQVESEI